MALRIELEEQEGEILVYKLLAKCIIFAMIYVNILSRILKASWHGSKKSWMPSLFYYGIKKKKIKRTHTCRFIYVKISKIK